VNDYYGTDIDTSARLMKKAMGNRIVMSEVFYNKVMADIRANGIDIANTFISEISNTYIEDFKGVPYPVEFRVVQLK
jgi:hypothetical protein